MGGAGASASGGGPAAATWRDPANAVGKSGMWQQWGGGHEKQTLDKYIALFNKTHPGIHVGESPVSDNTKIVAAISGGRRVQSARKAHRSGPGRFFCQM